MSRIVRAAILSGLVLLSGISEASAQLSFNASSSGLAQADAAFEKAADAWSIEFGDNMTVNLALAFADLGSVSLASSTASNQTNSFSEYSAAVSGDISTDDDLTFSSSLPTGSSFSVFINRTLEASGAESENPYLDNNGGANNTTVRLTTANAKALGLRSANDALLDASITFNSSFAWDFNRDDGIDEGTIDFIGVAMHEIGHALGFESGVDTLDINGDGLSSDDEFDFVSSIDFMRFSGDSEAAGADIDWTADARDKFLSIDGGATKLVAGDSHWSTGFEWGDGEQASHWKDGLSIGIMDPTTSGGLLNSISVTDIRVFDAMGYDRIVAVPEPGSAVLLGGLLLFGLQRRRRVCSI